jgi:hypothetical protein
MLVGTLFRTIDIPRATMTTVNPFNEFPPYQTTLPHRTSPFGLGMIGCGVAACLFNVLEILGDMRVMLALEPDTLSARLGQLALKAGRRTE